MKYYIIIILFVLYSSYSLFSSYERFKSIKEYVEKPQETWKSVQEERQARVKSVCEKYGNKTHRPIILHEYVFSRKHKLLWCKNLKVGTTTWIDTTFSEISNLTSRKKMMRLFRTRPADLRFLENDRYVSFSIVRHPFERLVSAFYDFVYIRKRRNKYKKMSFEEFT